VQKMPWRRNLRQRTPRQARVPPVSSEKNQQEDANIGQKNQHLADQRKEDQISTKNDDYEDDLIDMRKHECEENHISSRNESEEDQFNTRKDESEENQINTIKIISTPRRFFFFK
jgi:phosphatidate phosphatase PAH1